MDYLLQLDPTGTCCDCGARSSPCATCSGGPSVCCANGSCSILSASDCANINGHYIPNLTNCVNINCNQGGCCNAGNCSPQTYLNCISGGGTYLGDGTNCNGINCNQGACCTNQNCTITSGSNCTGIYQGDGTTCNTTNCSTNGSSGACCTNGSCNVLTFDGCYLIGGVYLGPDTTCSPNPCPPVPSCCASHYNAFDGSGRKFLKTRAVTSGGGDCTGVNFDVRYDINAESIGTFCPTTCTCNLGTVTCTCTGSGCAGNNPPCTAHSTGTCSSDSSLCGVSGCVFDQSGCTGCLPCGPTLGNSSTTVISATHQVTTYHFTGAGCSGTVTVSEYRSNECQ